jgi:tRNA A37 threonylcarbamoyladenosine dehydratase
MDERFARTALLIGEDGLAKLAGKSVAVVGLGGVGSFAAEALARSGVGHLTLVDFDTVSTSNINRQLHALDSTIGRPKVEVLAERFRLINPKLQLTLHQAFCAPENRATLITKDLDYVVDAIDSVASKIDLVLYCRELGIPIISAMGAGGRLDPTCFQVADISKTHGDPLAKAVRAGLRQAGVEKGVKVVFSAEPFRGATEEVEIPGKRRAPGSIAFVPPVAGFILAAEVVKELLKGN